MRPRSLIFSLPLARRIDGILAARRLLEHARAFQPIQDGRIYIEQINHPFLFGDRATPAGYSAGLAHAISHGWLELHESGTFVKLTQSCVDLFA
ncbi:hypothetical protein CQ12_40835 [Bradyrhizobium jicamae]|uniref:Uncharacterized protein n=1 Tax=Bradyrhizobium jicamae TaxID=280332 RepID=A0A0R3LG43_9BRAD|nr:hypothetical protein [Bradyrhizobium jicamae]KRR06744.1 hypothetical protein CQ12_40835 [Bradyrhizobium jicamae]